VQKITPSVKRFNFLAYNKRNMKNTQKGFAVSFIIAIVAAVILLSSFIYFPNEKEAGDGASEATAEQEENNTPSMQPSSYPSANLEQTDLQVNTTEDEKDSILKEDGEVAEDRVNSSDTDDKIEIGNKPAPTAIPQSTEGEEKTLEEESAELEAMIKAEEDRMAVEEEIISTYSGTILAGSSSPLLDFNKADYDIAVNSEKLVVLYFYATWCPICRAEFPKMQQAFDELETGKVVGFRINFNDGDTDNDEVDLAGSFGVAYQHTKVFVKGGVRILKSPEGWEKDRYLSEINSALNS